MTYGDELTLKEAAKFAGVSEGTMRSWVKDVPGVSRVPGGGYRIPREGLQGYIAAYKSGSKAVASSASKGKGGATAKGQLEGPMEGLIDELRAENQRLRLELSERSAELREARSDLKEAQGEIRKLEAELRAHLSGGISGALSRWIKGDRR
jgi:excisionase family DNA binding protein